MQPEKLGYDPTAENSVATPGTDFSVAGQRRERAAIEEILSESQQFKQILQLFGTEEARSKFTWLCEQYVEHYHTSSSSEPENPKVENHKIKRGQAHRSHYHNQIMEILRKLISAQKAGSSAWKLLEGFQDRATVERVLLQGDWKE